MGIIKVQCSCGMLWLSETFGGYDTICDHDGKICGAVNYQDEQFQIIQLLRIRRTPSPAVRQKVTFASYKGDGESRAKHKERTYPTNENTHTLHFRTIWSVHSKTHRIANNQ